jgi:hypothetical protein
MKICSKCKIKKNELEFSKNRSQKDGLNNYCKICYNIIRHNLRSKKWKFPDKPYIGENNILWKGIDAKYVSKHTWLRNNFGKANHCENPDCKHKSVGFDWANISGKYLREVSDYKQLCRSCHNQFDFDKKIKKEFCKHGHKFTKENTCIRKNNGSRICKICRDLYNAKRYL